MAMCPMTTDSDISPTPVANRCTKLSILPCNLHSQKLAVECFLELSDIQCGTVIGCHLSNKSVRQISALLELLRSTVGPVIAKWKRLGAITAQLLSGSSHKLTEQDR